MDSYHPGCSRQYQYMSSLSLSTLELDKWGFQMRFLQCINAEIAKFRDIQSCIAFALILAKSINACWVFGTNSATITFIDILKSQMMTLYWNNVDKPDMIHYKRRNHHSMHTDRRRKHLCIRNIVGIYWSDPYQSLRIRLYQNTKNHLTYSILKKY